MTSEIGRQATVVGWEGSGMVTRVMGRTVEVEFWYGIVSADRDKVTIH